MGWLVVLRLPLFALAVAPTLTLVKPSCVPVLRVKLTLDSLNVVWTSTLAFCDREYII